MLERRLLMAAAVTLAGVVTAGMAEAQSPPIRIVSVRLADQDGQTRSRGCRRLRPPRAYEQVFILELLENVTAQTQAYSIGRNYDGQGVYGGGTGTIDPMRRTLLSGGGGVFGPGAHTAVITLCTFESYPCGDGIDDEVLEQVTFEFNIRE